ncbi:hypothetical protein OHB41_26175 [Streptomyces sp. NBC_01571]|uniref:hypothetical protein n=1 Tax=Streptomyces sp. NBC_01571 TaxID=2975883 RepID=UPI002258606C|nr:hypothetical protein [Streptomyces sp. NBC_01571]MCX4576596.1 hypothetical protein [Streptomyces sp. NBC_01571]
MAWDEWEQLKTAAVERHTTQMQLNQLPADPGGSTSGGSSVGADELRSDKAAWTKAGEGVGSLREDLGKAWAKAESGQTGLEKGAGCLTAAAQKGVYDSWRRYVKDVSGVCDGLAGVLEKTGNDQLRTDEVIEAEIAKLKSKYYEDAPASRGQAKGQ